MGKRVRSQLSIPYLADAGWRKDSDDDYCIISQAIQLFLRYTRLLACMHMSHFHKNEKETENIAASTLSIFTPQADPTTLHHFSNRRKCPDPGNAVKIPSTTEYNIHSYHILSHHTNIIEYTPHASKFIKISLRKTALPSVPSPRIYLS